MIAIRPIGFALTKEGNYLVTWFSDGSAQYRPLVRRKGKIETQQVVAHEAQALAWNAQDFQTFYPFGKPIILK